MAKSYLDEKKLSAFVRKKIAARLEIAGEFVEGAAKLLCPVDTGNLRQSITHKVDEKDLSVTIGTNVEYAPYVEFGTGEHAENGQGRKGGWNNGKFFTHGNKPQPFLRPALLNNIPAVRRILGAK